MGYCRIMRQHLLLDGVVLALSKEGILTNSDRGREPEHWKHAPVDGSIKLMWHHTISWSCLRTVWNGLVAGEHWDVMVKYLRLAAAPGPEQIVADIRAGRLGDNLDRDVVHTILTWQTWNIIDGPIDRVDDPGDRTERWPLALLSSRQRARHQALKQFDNTMDRIRANLLPGERAGHVPAMSAEDARSLDAAIDANAALLHANAPAPFDKDMWVKATEGRASRKSPNQWDVKPKWRKAQWRAA